MIGLITNEVQRLRQSAADVVAKATAEKDALEARAAALEAKAASMPAELAQMPEDVALRAWDRMKSFF